MNVYIDIETIPEQPELEAKLTISDIISAPAQMKRQETIDDWHNGSGKHAGEKMSAIDLAYRKTSFDGGKGQVCSIAFAVDDREIISANDSSGEKELLSLIFDSISSELAIKKRPPFFIGHYIGGFDLKFLYHRCVVNNIKPPFALPFNGRHGQDFFDTMIGWAGYKNTVSQDSICRALGIKGKPSDIDGAKVWDFYRDGKIKEIEEYNRDDVDKNRQIHNRMMFL